MSHQNYTIQPDFSINEALKIIRKEKKLTYQSLADKCGVSKGYIFQIEKGTSDPSLGIVYKLCKVLDVSLPDLIDIKLNNIKGDERKLVRKFRKLPNPAKERAYTFLSILDEVWNKKEAGGE